VETRDSGNLLVSIAWRAPGRSRREIVARLRALGDQAPLVTATDRKGLMAVRTSLDARDVTRGLRALHRNAPDVFRYTSRWAPVDLWSAPDLESLGQAVASLRHRIAPGERWRITIERRAESCLPRAEMISALAALVDAKVDLGHPDKILRIDLFSGCAALAVVTPDETFSVGAPDRQGP
jgi:tRNA(Ser,Leu) C12 N-acetylase TAN1